MKLLILVHSQIFICVDPALMVFLGCNPDGNTDKAQDATCRNQTNISPARILCTEDQYELTAQLLRSFRQANPGVMAEIFLYDLGVPVQNLFLGRNDLALVPEPQSGIPEEYWGIQYAREGLVAIFNESNPDCEKILESGIGIQQLMSIFTGDYLQDTGSVQGYEPGCIFNVYISPEECVTAKLWATFLGIENDDFAGAITGFSRSMVDAVKSDTFSIGFCSHRNAYDPYTRKVIPGIRVVPLDCNSDGELGEREKLYDDLDAIQRAMWLGKYPCHSFRNHYIILPETPTDAHQIELIKYIITDGQKLIDEAGFIKLRSGCINKNLTVLKSLLAFT